MSISESRLLYPRVSEIIGKQNIEEMRSIPVDILANACIRGTKVHDYCTAHAKKLWIPDIEEEYKPYVNAFIKWYDENVSELLYANQRLYDDQLFFTGEYDMIVILNNSGKVAMIDLKTSANASRSWPIQIAAYKRLCELNEIHADMYMNLHLKKNYTSKQKDPDTLTAAIKVSAVPIFHVDLKPSWEIFSSALKCYDYFVRKGAK